MRLLALFTMVLLWPMASFATTLEQVVQVLAGLAQKAGAPGDWSRVNQLQGMKWQLPAAKQTPVGYTRYGSMKLEGAGTVTAYFTGSQAEARQASLALPQGVDKREFSQTLQRLIPSAKIKQLRAGCKDDGEIGGTAVYQVDVPAAATVYVMMLSGTSKAGLDTELVVARQLDKQWNCAS